MMSGAGSFTWWLGRLSRDDPDRRFAIEWCLSKTRPLIRRDQSAESHRSDLLSWLTHEKKHHLIGQAVACLSRWHEWRDASSRGGR